MNVFGLSPDLEEKRSKRLVSSVSSLWSTKMSSVLVWMFLFLVWSIIFVGGPSLLLTSQDLHSVCLFFKSRICFNSVLWARTHTHWDKCFPVLSVAFFGDILCYCWNCYLLCWKLKWIFPSSFPKSLRWQNQRYTQNHDANFKYFQMHNPDFVSSVFMADCCPCLLNVIYSLSCGSN